MKNLFGFLALSFFLITGCNQDASKEIFSPSDENLESGSIFAPLMSYSIDPAIIADFHSRKGNAVERPIKFKSSGILYPVAESDECPGQMKMVIEGSGIGSHVGTFTNYLYYCFNASGRTSDVTGKVVAANGDELNVMLIGAGTDPELGYYQTYIITGGSGRFTDASGSYTLYGAIDYANGQYSHEGGGSIIY